MRLTIALFFALTGMVQAQNVGYGGPGILSRGTRGAGQRAGESMSIRPFASVMATYDSGVVGVGLDQNGNITDPGALYGVDANIGAYGTKSWKKQRLGLNYVGGYRHYTNNQFYNGSDHMLAMDYTRQVGRRSSFMLRGTGGTTSRSFGGVGGVGAVGGLDPSFLGIPTYDIFDNRAYFVEVQGMLTTQFGSRNGLTVGGSGFAVRRRSKALVGMNGQRAFMDFSRKVTRYTAIGVSYQWFHVDYPRVFGEADTHALMATFNKTIGRAWSIGLGAGVYRSDFAGVRFVRLDPVIAELLGTTSGREAFNSINTAPAFQGNVTRSFRRSSLSVSYNRSANPGNGVILLNSQETGWVTYSYNASRKWSMGANGGYGHFKGLGGFSGEYSTASVGGSTSYRFWQDLHFTFNVDVRRSVVQSSDFNRTGLRLAGGVTYSPGEFPISFR